jgi:SNW domain-containing protein 1
MKTELFCAQAKHLPIQIERDLFQETQKTLEMEVMFPDFVCINNTGAYPEIHVAQYPLEMGRKKGTETKSVPVQLDSQGRVKYEAVLGGGDKRIVQARHEDLVARKVNEDDIRRPDPEKEAETTLQTKQALEKVLQGKVNSAQATNVNTGSGDATYIRYTPSQKSAEGPESRVIRLTEAPSDPLEPPKFKQKKAPRGPPSPPVPVMHSPPRKVTVKDQQDWKIPPCISNWKNRKGYTIPLDKRLAADGRGLQETIINDSFAKFSESLYIAERVAREEVAKRADVENRIKLKEKEKKEEMLRKLAQEARMERATSQVTSAEDDQLEDSRRERDQIREERRKERERDLRMQRNKSAASRNEERDVSERIALGMNVPTANTETQYDQRLFNQSQGMDSGFGDEDSYNVYSKPLFHASSANALYRPKKGDSDAYGGEEDYNKLLDTNKFKPDKEFSGAGENTASKGSSRDKPVEFEKVEKEEDVFGLDEFLTAAKSGSKALDKIGKSGKFFFVIYSNGLRKSSC